MKVVFFQGDQTRRRCQRVYLPRHPGTKLSRVLKWLVVKLFPFTIIGHMVLGLARDVSIAGLSMSLFRHVILVRQERYEFLFL